MKKIEALDKVFNFAIESLECVNRKARLLAIKHKSEHSDYINYEKAYKELIQYINQEYDSLVRIKGVTSEIVFNEH